MGKVICGAMIPGLNCYQPAAEPAGNKCNLGPILGIQGWKNCYQPWGVDDTASNLGEDGYA